jgi:hypothetical protein
MIELSIGENSCDAARIMCVAALFVGIGEAETQMVSGFPLSGRMPEFNGKTTDLSRRGHGRDLPG